MLSLGDMKKVLLAITLVALLAGCGKDNAITVKKDVNELKDAEIIAFPGAEGAGKFTKGGRGGDVYHVTTFKDSGPGSFREGIESIEGPRTIVFDLSGTIRLKKDIKIKDVSYLTIAGQTAQGKGITFADRNLRIENCSHVIARYFRIRLGDENKPDGTGLECITIEYSNHVMLDHLSLSWGIDGNGDFRGLKHSDAREGKLDLNPDDPADGNQDRDNDGFTNSGGIHEQPDPEMKWVRSHRT